jgi:hypothetical protein
VSKVWSVSAIIAEFCVFDCARCSKLLRKAGGIF